MAMSKSITVFVNFMALLCSIPVIGAGIWLASRHNGECIHLVKWPILTLGILLLLVSLAGFVGAYWNFQSLLALYLFAMAALIVLLVALLAFGFVVTRSDGSYIIHGAGFKEYRLSNFSPWLRDHVTSAANWPYIRNCLSSSAVCANIAQQFITPDRFFRAPLSPLQAGCCKPPIACGYEYVNPTVWINAAGAGAWADRDCGAWSNDQMQLCYGCQSCRAGLLGEFREEWRKASLVLVAAAVALICVYAAACSAFRRAQTEGLHRRYKQGYV